MNTYGRGPHFLAFLKGWKARQDGTFEQHWSGHDCTVGKDRSVYWADIDGRRVPEAFPSRVAALRAVFDAVAFR